MSERERAAVQKLEEDWSKAMVRNDAQAIGRFISEDWIIIGPDGSLTDRAAFLGVIESGDLTHEAMDSDEWRVRVFGDTAIVTARVKSAGAFRRRAFSTRERSTSVYAKRDGRWLCVLTQLSPIATPCQPEGGPCIATIGDLLRAEGGW